MPGRTRRRARRRGRRSRRRASERPADPSRQQEMRPVHAKLLAIVTILLCACGGGSAGPAASPQPEPFRPEPPRRTRGGRRCSPRSPSAGQDRATGRGLDSGHLCRVRRGRVRPDGDVGGFAPRGRHHRLGGLAARHRRQAQPAATALGPSPAGLVGSRGRHQHPVQRRHAAAPQYGRGRHGERQPRLRDGAHHRARGTRGRGAPRVRPGGRRQQQPRQPDHQHPLVRRGPRRGGTHGGRRGPRPAGQRDAGHGQALPRARRTWGPTPTWHSR